MNRDLAAAPGAPDEVDGVIHSFELAFRMHDKGPELLDISREPQAVRDAYERDETEGEGDMPYPPDYPKMPGEPKRVQPSRDRNRKRSQ